MRESDKNTIIVGDLHIPLTANKEITQIENNKKLLALNDTLDEMDIINIFRIFEPRTPEYTFNFSAHKTDHKLGHKISLNQSNQLKSYQL